MILRRWYWPFLFLLIFANSAFATIRLPRFFSSHMVLQRQKPVPVWGWADAGEKLTVQLMMSGVVKQSRSVKTGKDGKWKIVLDPTEAGGPYQLLVKGKQTSLLLDDVLFGEVWLCSGQSNMEMLVNRVLNADEEKKNASFPQIRHFKIPHDRSLTPLEDVSGGEWQLASPETVGSFSAVAFFYARELYKTLNVPIGLINSSWGGTQVESWISKEAMQSFEEFKEPLAQMPRSLDSLSNARKQKLDEKIVEEQGSFPDPAEVKNFVFPNYDDSKWKTMAVPGYYDLKTFAGHDGLVWFRKEFILPDSLAGKSLVLNIGAIDDIDRTYINGVKVGESFVKTPESRTYIVPPGLLKAGKNLIAVRIEDLGAIGGIIGKPEQLNLSLNDYKLSLAGDWKFRIETSVNTKQFAGANVAGTILYNAMIAPLIPYALQGAIWYQGESNASRAYQYRKSFPLMISDWRKRWGNDFPFLFVQLASYGAQGGNSEKGSTWAELREAQALALKTLPNTGMAVITDIGETADIHPKNKQDVGKRLAYYSLKKVYQKDLVYFGPDYQSIAVKGNRAEITFSNTGSGLKSSDKYGYLRGFEIAGADQKFHWAQAKIEGDKVIVQSEQVAVPVAVRYNWADDNSEGNLYNKEGLPAAPFRTDTWKGITEEVRFK